MNAKLIIRQAFTGTMPEAMTAADRNSLSAFVDSCLRGMSMAGFLSNPVTGALLLSAVWITSPWLGAASTIGVVSATATAFLLGFDREQCRIGLYGYNGAICGAGLGTFLVPEFHVVVVVYIAIGTALTTPVLAALMRWMTDTWGVRPLTLPMNLIVMGMIAGLVQVKNGHVGPLISPRLVTPQSTTPIDTSFRNTSGEQLSPLMGIFEGVVHGIGQLLFLPTTTGGLLVLLGLACCSRLTAGLALLGSSAAVLTGMALGIDGFTINLGLVGLNGFLICVAVAGVFLRPTIVSVTLGVLGAMASSLVLFSLVPAVAAIGLPTAMSLPFCLIVPVIVVLKDLSPRIGRAEFDQSAGTTPEQHAKPKPTNTPSTGRPAVTLGDTNV